MTSRTHQRAAQVDRHLKELIKQAFQETEPADIDIDAIRDNQRRIERIEKMVVAILDQVPDPGDEKLDKRLDRIESILERLDPMMDVAQRVRETGRAGLWVLRAVVWVLSALAAVYATVDLLGRYFRTHQ